jgi:hypothetical protein
MALLLTDVNTFNVPVSDDTHKVWDTDDSDSDDELFPEIWAGPQECISEGNGPWKGGPDMFERDSADASVIGSTESTDVSLEDVTFTEKGGDWKEGGDGALPSAILPCVSSDYAGTTEFSPQSVFDMCSICRRSLVGDRLFCLRCPNHVLCGSCHDRFAASLWTKSEHDFVWLVPTSGIIPPVPPPPRPLYPRTQKNSRNWTEAGADFAAPPETKTIDFNATNMIDFNALLASEPSMGSIHHRLGHCHPCHYVHSKVGCRHGKMCGLCHYPHDRRKRGIKSKPMPQTK